jgi:SNF2 family DNA or RNA helicase
MELYAHQKRGIELAVANKNFALFWEPGMGKTLAAIEIFRLLKTPDMRLLVVCPLSLVHSAWGDDVAKFSEFTFSAYKDLNGEIPQIVAVNYETLISKKHLADITAMLRKYPFMCVVDESSRMKNFKSVTTKTLLSLAYLFKHRFVLSGTPMPNSEQELWGQIRFVNETALPGSFYAFRNIYFHLGRGNQTMLHPTGKIDRQTMMTLFQRGWKYQITKAKREELMRRIAPVVDWRKKEDALDLPEQIDQIRELQLTDSERKAYRDMEKFLVVELDDDAITATAALAKVMKMRQLSSGFAYDVLGKTHTFGQSKLNELDAVLEELGNQQVIIWVQFHAEVEAISAMLTEQGKTFTTLYADTKDREASVKAFQNGEAQYLIAHPRSAAHGLTMVNCSTCIYYSMDYSYEAYQQSRDRIHRIGQTKSCLYIHLLAKGTIDRPIYNVVKKKSTLQELVSGYARKLSKAAMPELFEEAARLVGCEDKR